MYRTGETLLQVVYEALYAPYGTGYDYEDMDWGLLYKMAAGSKLSTLTYHTVKRLSEKYKIPTEVLEQWEQDLIEGTA